MSKEILQIAVKYYEAMNKKDPMAMEKCLHPNVKFIGPLAQLQGRQAVMQAATQLFLMYSSLSMRAKFQSVNEVMVAYDLKCPPPIGEMRIAALLEFKEDLISQIEIFFDARPFTPSLDQVFS